MSVADNRQRYMPLPDDRLPGRGQKLAYPEAVLLVDPIEPEFKGEVQSNTLFLNNSSESYTLLCTVPQLEDGILIDISRFRWMISTNTHPRTMIIRFMVGYASTHLLVFGKLHLAMNSEMEDPSNKT